jgi:hypothetical protein
MLAAVAAFGRFWYRFIVGDDWVIAATVLVTLVVVALLLRAGVQAWWLLPVVVIAVLGVSLWRARRRQAR